jgi:hypothetical protein
VPLLPYIALSAAGRRAEGESGRALYRWFLALNVTLGAAVTFAIMLPMGLARTSYVGFFAMAVTLAGLVPSIGRAIVARRRAGAGADAGADAAPGAATTAGPESAA